MGVAALDADVTQVAEENLTRAVEWVPQEPAGWADRGLLYLRTGRLPEATHDIEQAHRLAPDEPDVLKLVGLLLQRGGRFGESAVYLRRAVERDPRDVEALFLLAQIVDQEQQEGSDAEYQRLMEQILAIRPENLHVLVERLRAAVRRSDAAAARDTCERLKRLSPGWSEEARTQLAGLDEVLAGPLWPDAVRSLLILGNVLKGEPGYAKQAGEVSPASGLSGRSLQAFLRLAPVRPAPAAPDMALTFTPEAAFASEPARGLRDGHWNLVLPVWLTGEGEPTLFVADAHEVRRAGDGAAIASLMVAPRALVPLDWNNDQRTDLLLAGPDGLQFLQQDEKGGFADVTAATELPEDVLRRDCLAALAADVDLDGDLDLVVAGTGGGAGAGPTGRLGFCATTSTAGGRRGRSSPSSAVYGPLPGPTSTTTERPTRRCSTRRASCASSPMTVRPHSARGRRTLPATASWRSPRPTPTTTACST
ncbi:MAG TPA: tetratricopeptide repeat protein [Pirellulales bacterium]|nr:tetratricopeptide repeat protein [Pirellulales bacterium]